mmetsp:Transcript_3479/g.21854  ORF Transcript_3479/g.21854 Transcript_3479/m.21854 type:complete len:82 (+) Transcript_3479:2559-2804(+)
MWITRICLDLHFVERVALWVVYINGRAAPIGIGGADDLPEGQVGSTSIVSFDSLCPRTDGWMQEMSSVSLAASERSLCAWQ